MDSRGTQSTVDDAGAAACRAGWSQLLGSETEEDRVMPVADLAARWLGFNVWFQCEWFHGLWVGCAGDRKLDETIAFLDRQVAVAEAVELCLGGSSECMDEG